MTELNLQRDGVMQVEYAEELKDAVVLAADAWIQFCTLPLTEKMKLATDNSFNGIGYETKVTDIVGKDRKEKFDYSTAGHIGDGNTDIENSNPAVKELIRAASVLPKLTERAILEVARAVQGPIGNERSLDEVAARSAPMAFFRFLHYPSGAPVGTEVAEPHADHSGITLHLFESSDGCQKLDFDKKTWSPLPVADGKAIAFGGMQLQLASQGEVTALCHRVISNETTSEVGRFAIVCFTALDGYPHHDRARNGRLQDKEPGFNYGMPHEEFSRLFTF